MLASQRMPWPIGLAEIVLGVVLLYAITLVGFLMAGGLLIFTGLALLALGLFERFWLGRPSAVRAWIPLGAGAIAALTGVAASGNEYQFGLLLMLICSAAGVSLVASGAAAMVPRRRSRTNTG